MTNVRLGSTGITVNKNGFGALPIQRISKDEAVRLLHKAFAVEKLVGDLWDSPAASA